MKYWWLLLSLLILPLLSQAQSSETIRTGRPGASIGAFTVGSRVFQVQTGINIGRMTWDSEQKMNKSQVTMVLRYGILERLEVSGVLAYSKIGWSDLESYEFDQQGLSAVQIGFRVNIRDGKGNGPNIGWQSRLKLNVLDEDFEQQRLASVHILALTQRLGRKVGIAANIGLSTRGNSDDKPLGLYTLNLNMPVSSKVSVFVENFGVFKEDLNAGFDTGLGYLVNQDLQLDASLGYGKNHGVEDMFVDFGLSWRMGNEQ